MHFKFVGLKWGMTVQISFFGSISVKVVFDEKICCIRIRIRFLLCEGKVRYLHFLQFRLNRFSLNSLKSVVVSAVSSLKSVSSLQKSLIFWRWNISWTVFLTNKSLTHHWIKGIVLRRYIFGNGRRRIFFGKKKSVDYELMIIWKLRTYTCHYYGKTHKLINYVKTETNLLAILYVRVQGAIDTSISTLLTLVLGNLIIEENISNSGNRQVSFKTINPLHAKRYYVNCTLLRRRNEFFFCQKKMFELDLRI